ncbi:unnamed protein product [Symbiodinium sp. KB8]|nr:unnamed protein product [Symbiodinium sp. KB8]
MSKHWLLLSSVKAPVPTAPVPLDPRPGPGVLSEGSGLEWSSWLWMGLEAGWGDRRDKSPAVLLLDKTAKAGHTW